ncbi:MucR family transcriptional regulator [Sphingobium ummariense]|uniref:Uncharacterized protein n=1 Tax=Sphingobium ummariense RL-3 TaxID=1346791 RepID=T0KF08_9SPHN|nr:MucR family transcriptional regulator [Sphingobium ummariense]EQB32008.1 hypothetical protein M529_11730 [Sphingobium ummariense RL-3]
MATAPKTAEPAQVDVVLQIPVADIEIGERLGAFWPVKAAAIGRLMVEDGQNEPIKIRKNGPRAAKPWTLVAGLHRLEGARLEQLRAIDAIVVSGDEKALRRIEASENIERGSRSPLERANFVRALADAAEARVNDQHEGLSQQEIAARARWSAMKAKAASVERDDDLNQAEAEHAGVNFTRVYGWRAEIAEAIGMSVESVKKDLALHRALIAPFPDLWRGLATHPLVGENASALREIASYAPEARRAIIEGLIEAPDMTLAQALEGLGLSAPKPAPATGATKFMNNAISNLSRLSVGDQRQIAGDIVATFKPAALVALREALDARIGAETPPPAPAEEKPTPAVPIRQSVKPDHIACLECGERHQVMKRHLRSAHGLQPGQYIARWSLPLDYPMVAPNYAEERRRQAMKLGLGGAK